MNRPKNYAWDAKDYAKNSQNQFQWAKELIPKLKLQGNEALLDIGCGDGKITAELANAFQTAKSSASTVPLNDKSSKKHFSIARITQTLRFK